MGGSAVETYEEARSVLRSRARVPVFPLPNIVLFPHTSLPLHIFEPRYRQMTNDALGTDRLIVITLLKPGWESEYKGSPDVFPIACAGLIEEVAPLPDGRINIRLRGLTRVEILSFVQETPYRIASIRVLEDRNDAGGPGFKEEKERLVAACASLLQEMTGAPAHPLTLDGDVPFAVVVNTLCQNLDMRTETKQSLLMMDDVRERCRTLVEILNRRWREIALEEAGRSPSSDDTIH